MIVVDTRVSIAAFAPGHVGHGSAVPALARQPQLSAQVAVGALAVLTRLPPES